MKFNSLEWNEMASVPLAIFLVFLGCGANVFFLEHLIKIDSSRWFNPRVGNSQQVGYLVFTQKMAKNGRSEAKMSQI